MVLKSSRRMSYPLWLTLAITVLWIHLTGVHFVITLAVTAVAIITSIADEICIRTRLIESDPIRIVITGGVFIFSAAIIIVVGLMW